MNKKIGRSHNITAFTTDWYIARCHEGLGVCKNKNECAKIFYKTPELITWVLINDNLCPRNPYKK